MHAVKFKSPNGSHSTRFVNIMFSYMRPPSPRGCPGLNYFSLPAESKAFTLYFFSSFEALNQSSSASAWQSHAAAHALAGIDKHFGFHIQLHPVNPRANRSVCRRLLKQGTTLKWRWLRRTKSSAHSADIRTCVYPGVTVPPPGYYPTGRNSSSTSRKGFGNPVSVKLLTTCKWQLWSKMWVFPRWHFVFSLMNWCQTDKKTCRNT